MKIPKQLKDLIDDGLVDEILRQLMSGKEATIFIVRCGTEITFQSLSNTARWIGSCGFSQVWFFPLHPLEAGDAFDVVGLGEHVDGLAGDDAVLALFAKHLAVARE